MAMNRLQRDQILIRALDLADSAILDNKERPSGTIVSTALSIGWLQEAIDFFHKKFPFSADILKASFTLAAGAISFSVPSDFILDFKNGLVLDDNQGRLIRRSLTYILNIPTGSTSRGKPAVYSVKGATIETRYEADKEYKGQLYYYALPAALAAATVPTFPDDLILVEYVWLKAQEWHRLIQVGSAFKFADDRIAQLQRSGIGNEAEEDQLDLDPTFASQPDNDPTRWMGKSSL